MDLIIKNAKLREEKELFDIGISNGKIQLIKRRISRSAKTEIDANGCLLTPTFVEPHIHLDKCLISEKARKNVSGTLGEAIEIIWEIKRKYTITDILQRASKVIESAISYGVTIIRTHVDVDPIGKLKPLEGLLQVKEKYKGIIDLQIVAFPQEGILQSPGTEELMEESIKLGADVIGGMPHNEMTEEDSKKHIDICFNLAMKYDKDIDMHVDETDDPYSRTLQYLAYKTIKENYQGRVTAAHVCALAAYNDYYAAKVIELVKKAKMNIITNPATNLMLEGRLDKEPRRRGITRVKELIKNGVNVCYGQDCVMDTFYPVFGRCNPLEVGLITAHAAQFTLPEEIEILFDMPTENAAKVLRLKDYDIRVKNSASFNILNARTISEAFRSQSEVLYVIKNGKVICETKKEVKYRFQ